MARRTEQPADYTLYDISAQFQERLAKWLSKNNIIIDIGATPEAFKIKFLPGSEVVSDSLEDAINTAMGSRSRTKHIDPQMEQRIYSFLDAKNAHLTFGASGDVFNVAVMSSEATGQASDVDLEIAIVFAEEDFWDHAPEPPGRTRKPRAAAAAAGAPARALSAAQRAEEEALQAKYGGGGALPPHDADAAAAAEEAALQAKYAGNRRRLNYAQWLAEVEESLTPIGASTQDGRGEYWRQLYRADFAPYEAAQEFLETSGSGEYAENRLPPRPSGGHRPRAFMPTPPSARGDTRHRLAHMVRQEERPFDPEARREHYAKPHHFAVNDPRPNSAGRKFMVLSRPDARGDVVLEDSSGYDFDTWEEAKAWADRRGTGAYAVFAYSVGSGADPKTWDSWYTPHTPKELVSASAWPWHVS